MDDSVTMEYSTTRIAGSDDSITAMPEKPLFDIEATRKELKDSISSKELKCAAEFEKVVDCFCNIMLVNLNTCLDERGNGRVAALVLACCMIDTFAGFYAGSAIKSNDVAKRYNKFVNKYLPYYKGNKKNENTLYYGLRCSLLHSFNEGIENKAKGKYESKIYLYAGKVPDDSIFSTGTSYKIYVSTFVEDVVKAITSYLQDVISEKETCLQENFKKHFDAFGILAEDECDNATNSSLSGNFSHSKTLTLKPVIINSV